MKNALRLGAAVAAATLVGVSDNSEADVGGGSWERRLQEARERGKAERPETWPTDRSMEDLIQNAVLVAYRAGIVVGRQDGCPDKPLELELDTTRAQVEELLMRLETMEQTCEDATQQNGYPIGCTKENTNTSGFNLICIGPSCVI